MKYSKDDLIRRPLIRTALYWIGILMVVIGTQGHGIGLGWKSLIVLFVGIFLLFMIHSAYEDLLVEKNDVKEVESE